MALKTKLRPGDSFTLLSGEIITNLSTVSVKLSIETPIAETPDFMLPVIADLYAGELCEEYIMDSIYDFILALGHQGIQLNKITLPKRVFDVLKETSLQTDFGNVILTCD